MEGPPVHLQPEDLEAFLKGTCAPDAVARLEAHIDACDDCRRLLSTVVRSQRDTSKDSTDQVAATPVTEGEVLAGKYRVGRVIGQGGMGSVVSAWHLQLNQQVALKFMLPALAADPQASGRFLREARAAARLQTPHVCRVLDLDALPNGTPYLAMEFMDGQTVAQALAAHGRFPVAAALSVISQALEALGEAHALGIVHRDFKPANIFLARRPDGTQTVKVLDFGIAKSVHPDIEQGLASTSARMLIGSPPYMAPEQVSFSAIDARTDLWAAGAVLYELLTGRQPFPGKVLSEVLLAVQQKPHRPVVELVPEVPLAVSALVDRCLQKLPEARFQDAQSLRAALLELGAGPTFEVAPSPAAPPARSTPRAAPAPQTSGTRHQELLRDAVTPTGTRLDLVAAPQTTLPPGTRLEPAGSELGLAGTDVHRPAVATPAGARAPQARSVVRSEPPAPRWPWAALAAGVCLMLAGAAWWSKAPPAASVAPQQQQQPPPRAAVPESAPPAAPPVLVPVPRQASGPPPADAPRRPKATPKNTARPSVGAADPLGERR